MPKSPFSTVPSQDLLTKVIRSLGLAGPEDKGWFSEITLNKTLVEEVKEELSTLYYPYVKKQVFSKEEFLFKHYLVCVRHVLRHYKYKLARKEKCMKIGDHTYQYIGQYQIISPNPTPTTVTFD